MHLGVYLWSICDTNPILSGIVGFVTQILQCRLRNSYPPRFASSNEVPTITISMALLLYCTQETFLLNRR